MLIFVRTTDGHNIAVRMPEEFLSETTAAKLDNHINDLKAMFPGNINYFYRSDDPDSKFYI